MADQSVEDLAVQLEGTIELTSMENGIKLVTGVLVVGPFNKWGVINIIRNAWKDMGEIQINWVQDNTYIIIVRDEEITSRILNQVPWATMKQDVLVKR